MKNSDSKFTLLDSILEVSGENRLRIIRLMHRIFESKEKDPIEEPINIDEGC